MAARSIPLLALAAVAGASGDLSALLQGDVRVQSAGQRGGPLVPGEQGPRAQALSVLRQLPPGLLPANVSMDDLMKLGMDVLAAFQDEKFTEAIKAAIKDMGTIVDGLNADTQARLARLNAANVTTSAEAFELLKGFFLEGEATVAKVKADVARSWQQVTGAFPSPEDLEKIPFLKPGGSPLDLAPPGALDPDFRFVFADNGTGFCGRFSVLFKNMTELKDGLETQVRPGFEQMLPMVSQMEPMIAAMAPGAAPAVMRVVNMTAELVTKALADGSATLDGTLGALDSLGSQRLHCGASKVHSSKVHSGASGGLLGAPVAAAALLLWLLRP